jgi:hypothetical protein
MSFTTKLKETEYERMHDGKYVLIVTNDGTRESAFASCTDETLKAQLKHLKKELSDNPL